MHEIVVRCLHSILWTRRDRVVLAEIACSSVVPRQNEVLCDLGTRLPVWADKIDINFSSPPPSTLQKFRPNYTTSSLLAYPPHPPFIFFPSFNAPSRKEPDISLSITNSSHFAKKIVTWTYLHDYVTLGVLFQPFLIHSWVRSETATRPVMSFAENLSGTTQKTNVVLSNRTS